MTDLPPPDKPPAARKSPTPLFWLAVIVIAAVLIWLAYTLFASRSSPAPTQAVGIHGMPYPASTSG